VKDVYATLFGAKFDNAAHFLHEMSDVDRRKRIGALDDQEIARPQTAQHLSGTQNGQRALEAFEIEARAIHFQEGKPCV
jgi:hypothetical protein